MALAETLSISFVMRRGEDYLKIPPPTKNKQRKDVDKHEKILQLLKRVTNKKV